MFSVIMYRATMDANRLQAMARRQHADPFEYAQNQETFERVAASLKVKEFLPGETQAGLLLALPPLLEVLKNEALQKKLAAYHGLNWTQKLFSVRPGLEEVDVKEIPFAELGKNYSTQAERVQLFCALCDLHERKLVNLDTKYPFKVSLAPRGKQVIQVLKENAKVPDYEDFRLPPYPYEDLFEQNEDH